MNIALIGYGKMGKVIEKIALERGHTISFIVNSQNKNFTSEELKTSDVVIEFTRPEFAVKNMHRCFEAQVPVVVGTTGWYDKFDAVKNCCTEHNGTLLHATNFSLGVNIFYEINQHLAALMSHQNQYTVKVEETHHTEKVDAPSGTAISIAEGIIANHQEYNSWSLSGVETPNLKPSTLNLQLPVLSHRLPNVPGTHTVTYESAIDKIEITHEAKSRHGFALGAVLAAEFIADKKGIFTMKDLLKF
jgi:4-hydroxy-tetrahydrodipicolinate reductase